MRETFEEAIATGVTEGAVAMAVFMREHQITTAAGAYALAIESADAEWTPRAQFALGSLREDDGDTQSAAEQYLDAFRSGQAGTAAAAGVRLAALMEEVDLTIACHLYAQVIDVADPHASPRAAFLLGRLSVTDDPPTAIHLFTLAETAPDENVAAWASLLLGLLLDGRDAGAARAAYEKAVLSDTTAAPVAALFLGLLVRRDDPPRAERAFTQAAASGSQPFAARAAFDLGVLLGRDEGERWLRISATSGDPSVSSQAQAFLDILLHATTPGGEEALERANALYEQALQAHVRQARDMLIEAAKSAV